MIVLLALPLLLLGTPALWPEDSPPLPIDGTASVTLPASFPIIAVATTTGENGIEHAVVWGPSTRDRSWLYQSTQLTFFFVKKAGKIQLKATADGITASGAGVQTLKWQTPLNSWSLEDRGSPGGAETRLFALVEQRSSSCPSDVVTHWLQLHKGHLTELLMTHFSGEGGGDERYFNGTIALWPAGGSRAADHADLLSPGRFAPIVDVPASQRVVVYDETIDESRLCGAVRTVYRYAGGRLTLVRTEPLISDFPACAR